MALLGYEKLDDIVGGTKNFIRFLVGYENSEKNWWGEKNIQKIQKSPGTSKSTPTNQDPKQTDRQNWPPQYGPENYNIKQ